MVKSDSTLTVSVVICTLRRPKDLVRCLGSVARQTSPPLEIILVDASPDWEAYASDYQHAADGVRLRHVPAPAGLTLQRNTGVRLSQGDIILFLDDDVVLDETYIAAITEAFEMDPAGSVWGVVGEIWNDPYEHGPSAWKNKLWSWLFLQGGQKPGGGRMLPSGKPMYCSHSDTIVEVEVSFGTTAYRRKVFQEFLFDEHLQKYGFMEDTDFSYRVSRNHRICHTPLARLAHHPSPEARLSPAELAQMHIYHHTYVFRKDLPQTLFNQLCFWWCNLGVLVHHLLRGSRGEMLGLVRAYRRAWTNAQNHTSRLSAAMG